MEIELQKIDSLEQFISTVLMHRASICSKSSITRHYSAIADGIECAFVAIDVPQDRSYLCVLELLVEPKLRRRGIGTAIINKCQLLAQKSGCKKVSLIPMPIEKGTSEKQLVRWYKKLGFIPSSQQHGLFEIVF